MKLQELPPLLSICRLDPGSEIPSWALGSQFLSITRSVDELSIVCEQSLIPTGLKCDRGWKVFKVAGTLDFSLTGILASIANPLAEAKISIFALSTFDTDYVLVKEGDWAKARQALHTAGFIFF